MKYCTLCGIPFTRRLNEDWIENVRAVWIEGDSWNRTAVSGVGRWGEFDDIPSVTVPTNPQIRHNGQSGPGNTIEVDLTPDDPTLCTDPDGGIAWGYGFHESCWSIFTKNYTPNLDALFAACLSTPTGATTLLDWGHDYGGASKIEQMFDMPVRASCFRSLHDIPHVFRSDPYQVPGLIYAIEGAVRLQTDAFLSRLEPTVTSLKSDSFSRLVPEILQSIVILLPTSDVHSLRLASPVFATLELPERFWASRFQPGHEFEYLPEVHDRSPQSWRAFYHSLKIWTQGIPSMVNRRRVWGLAKRLQATLTQMDGVSCQGSPLSTWHETTPDGPDNATSEANFPWHTASRAVVSLGDSFFYGSRVLKARVLYFPEPMKLQQMSVSFVDTAAGRFISGFTLVDSHDQSYAVGYQHEDLMLRILLDEPIRGWELAMDLSGITGIAAVHSDGKLSSWAGESAGIPRWRLEGTQAVSAVKAEFDAFKLVSLSRDRSPNQQNWLNNCLWYPEVPKEGLLFNGSIGGEPKPEYNLPVTTVLFGQSDGRYLSDLSDLSEIVVWIFDICHIAGIEFHFTDSSYDRHLGYIGPFDESYPVRRNFPDSHDSSVSFAIDGPSGERLTSIDVQTRGSHVVGLKLRTNLDRIVQTPDYPYGTDKGWVTVHAKGSKIIGMFATLARPFWDLGLISIQE
ncbi:uncharacterized protein FPRO_15633 [Fusarium proliferatum ET1]|uniref:DUF7600 domain-containing protein n=1 Tax=Fusarium proliferatum (strain ET1) TaxID=1227346 RepID=A0A1L7VYI5_FUSPR|nr:uncharacterized protein FPRO_15633 [Fusarium proliferatum ET1]CZR45192.1 uncharacterized protein FPRO_15633 [Fusarium proliferatum ET1]